MKTAAILLPILLACSSGSSSGSDCSAIESEIHDAAVKRGYDGNHDGIPDDIGICDDTNPQIQADFGKACAKLKACH